MKIQDTRKKLGKYDIDENTKNKLVINEPYYKSTFNNKIVFADYIATGRPSKIVDTYISNSILPYYSNTHSNAYCGMYMKNLIQDTKNYIKNTFSAQDKKIVFTGNGATGAINHLIYCMNLQHYYKVNIILSIYEHNSNYLPWIELSKKYKNTSIIILEHNDTFTVTNLAVENIIKNTDNYTTNIVSVTACSNVTGIVNSISSIYNTMQKYNTVNNKYICYKKNILLVDYACLAPYTSISAKYVDAMFISPHKYIGGYSVPGILIADQNLFNKNLPPFCPGGNCTKKVCRKEIVYDPEIETKESGGTPNIVGIVKFKYVLKIQQFYADFISKKEHLITYYVFNRASIMQQNLNKLVVLLPEITTNRLPILCIGIHNIHYNLIVVLLNDLFGIQTRGGVSCTALLSEIIKNKYNINGWCRISFHWLMDIKTVDYILDAIEFVYKNIDTYKNSYKYIPEQNLFKLVK